MAIKSPFCPFGNWFRYRLWVCHMMNIRGCCTCQVLCRKFVLYCVVLRLWVMIELPIYFMFLSWRRHCLTAIRLPQCRWSNLALLFTRNTPSYWYRDHIINRPSKVYNGDSYTRETVSYKRFYHDMQIGWPDSGFPPIRLSDSWLGQCQNRA